MLSRALSLATVMLLVGCFAAIPVQAQNLEASKSPSQIFAGACAACHKSPRGLLKTVAPGSLSGFLRQHYTTSSDMASLLSAYLTSNGAADTRYGGAQSKPARDAKSEPRPAEGAEQLDRQGRRLRAAAPSREAAKPDADGLSPQAEPGRQERNAKRLARPGDAPDAASGQSTAGTASEFGPEGRKSSPKQKLSRRGRPGIEEPPKPESTKPESTKPDSAKLESGKPEAAKTESTKTESVKTDAAKTDEPSAAEPAKGDRPKSEAAKDEGNKAEDAKPASQGKSEAAITDGPKQTGGESAVLRADPVPPVTPAQSTAPPVPAAVSSDTSEPAKEPPVPAQPAPASVTASAPPSAPVTPAGPPAPPISQ